MEISENEYLFKYYSAINNEYIIDRTIMSARGKPHPPVIFRFLRFEKFLNRFNFLYFFFDLATRLWIPFFRLLCALKYSRFRIGLKNPTSKKTLKEVFIISSQRSITLLDSGVFNTSEFDIMNIPWFFNTNRGTSIMLSLTSSDIRYAYSMTRKIDFKYLNSLYGDRAIYMQTFDAFEWFLTLIVLSRMNYISITFTNHYDRWAVLFDSLQIERKTQIQHGLLDEQFILPAKLTSIDVCYVYNLESEKIFRDLYHDNNTHKTKYMKIDLKLKTTSLANKKNTILIIGSMLDGIAEMEKISSILDVFHASTIFIKPHPVHYNSIYDEYFRNETRVTIIQDANFFPDVSLVLSPVSTLGFEYELIGTPVVYYLDFNTEELLTTIKTSYCN